MRSLYLAAALLAFACPALADYVPPVNLPPCNSDTNGTELIVSRPPTADELAASVADRPLNSPPLLTEREHITCNGSTWTLSSTVPLYRGGQ